MKPFAAGIALCCTLTFTSIARSESAQEEPLLDMETLGLVAVPAAFTVGLHFWASPPHSPRFFDEVVDPQPVHSDTVPEWSVAVWSLSGLALIAATAEEDRRFQLKGYSEGLVTTLAVTEIAKNFVGRQRPTYEEGNDDPDLRRSFFSGHASVTAATSTYLALYLYRSEAWRPSGTLGRVTKGATLLAIGATPFAVSASRVHDNRHHVSDVATGLLVGGALGATFYLYQEHRYLDRAARRLHLRDVALQPMFGAAGASVLGRF